jgi:hypothetical protein
MRQRLSWDEGKVAEISKQADPFTMNQTRQEPPVEKYRTGDPSDWGEEPCKATPWKNEGRTETGHPAPAREAVVNAKKLEDKALKCLTIAQRMLPGAEESLMEDQATDLMFLPERAILATLQRQSELATKIASEKKDDEEVKEDKEAAKKEDKKEEEVEAAKKDMKDEKKKEVEAAKAKKDETTPPEEKKAAEKKEDKKDEKKEEVEAAKAKKEEKEEEVEAAKKEDKKEEEVEAAKKDDKKEEMEEKKAQDLLDVIFADETVPEVKVGAKKLSGLVKQASGENPLDGLWSSAPDISAVFGKNR